MNRTVSSRPVAGKQWAAPTRWEYALAAVLLTAVGLLFAHPDILETANHSWLFLDHVFSGSVGDFYTDVLAHQNSLYYINAAHYNIFLYALFGLWLLPVYGVVQLTGGMPDPTLISLWCKALACLFAVGCALLTRRLAQKLGADSGQASWAGLGFLLSPVTVFATFTMGQYDSICLFFLLWALCFYLDGRLWRFALVMGLAVACKMFALLVFLPLLVLREKRVFRLAGLAVAGLWLYLPTSLAFAGRSGDMAVFNELMVQRLFAARLAGGIADLPLFLCLLAVTCAACWLYRPQQGRLDALAAYVPLLVLTVLFVFIYWHPQWLVLMVPFALLTALQARLRYFWAWLDILLAAGFFLLCYVSFPGQLEANLLAGGMLSLLGVGTVTVGSRTLAFYFALLPWVLQLAPVLFAAPLVCGTLFKMPWREGVLADRLTGKADDDGRYPALTLRHWPAWLTRARCAIWGVFLAGYVGCWLLPCLFQFLKCAT